MVKKKKKPTPQQKEQRSHRNRIRTIFRDAGFHRDPKGADKEFVFLEQASDFDDYFIFENVLLCLEYTIQKKVSDHLKPKKLIYDKIENNPKEFVEFICEKFPTIKSELLTNYSSEEVVTKIVYCPTNDLEEKYRKNIPFPVYLDVHDASYFKAVSHALKLSALPELLNFLGINYSSVGRDGVMPTNIIQPFEGMLLPASETGYGGSKTTGVKVVSFYARAEDILDSAYVFRKNGWRDKTGGYQRLVQPSKINGIRKHIKEKRSVFPTNVVVSLPAGTNFLDDNDKDVDPGGLTKIQQVKFSFAKAPNSIGLIDGQHRVFAYHRTQNDDKTIKKEREKRTLLVTGFVYPESWKERQRMAFEAGLFLEINANQTKVPPDVRHNVEMMTAPFSDTSIAARILFGLNSRSGPLELAFQRYFYETNKIKTASVISYAMTGLTRPSPTGEKNLFSSWDNTDKDEMVMNQDDLLLGQYEDFCIKKINHLLKAFKSVLGSEKWTYEKTVQNYFLNTTRVNAMLILLRLLIEHNLISTTQTYTQKLEKFPDFDLSEYKSSQYSKMAHAMAKQYFGIQGLD